MRWLDEYVQLLGSSGSLSAWNEMVVTGTSCSDSVLHEAVASADDRSMKAAFSTYVKKTGAFQKWMGRLKKMGFVEEYPGQLEQFVLDFVSTAWFCKCQLEGDIPRPDYSVASRFMKVLLGPELKPAMAFLVSVVLSYGMKSSLPSDVELFLNLLTLTAYSCATWMAVHDFDKTVGYDAFSLSAYESLDRKLAREDVEAYRTHYDALIFA